MRSLKYKSKLQIDNYGLLHKSKTVTVNSHVSPRGTIRKNEFLGGDVFEGGLISSLGIFLKG